MHAAQVISTHPDVKGNVNEALTRCLEECFNCAQHCTTCADACLGEEMDGPLKQCIRLNMDCADICIATGTLASRRSGSNEAILKEMLKLCESACRLCAEECEKHASQHEHCLICGETCRRCEEACRAAASTIT